MSREATDLLRTSWNALQREWAETSSVWRDQVAMEFERIHWSKFENRVPSALSVMQDLEDILDQAERSTCKV